jgi:hypothetical protein
LWKDFMRLDPERFAAVVAGTIKSAVSGLAERLSSLEKRLAEIPPARDGAMGPQGEKGLPGDRGEAGPAGPVGPHGERGEAGPQGPEGPAGAVGPVGEKGMDGAAGRDGRDGVPGAPGAMGEKGYDGKDGRDGKDGVDGLGFDDYDEHMEDGGRVLVRTWRSGDRVKEFRHTTHMPVFRGTYDATKSYDPGDLVMWGGSMWVAKESARSIAPDTDSATSKRVWGLSVMRGRQGKQGTKGDPGDRGPQGPQGIRGQQGY